MGSFFRNKARMKALGAVIGAVIGCAGCSGAAALRTTVSNVNIDPGMYVVRSGDTIDSVAFRYRLTPAQLAAYNPGMPARLMPGDRLIIRGAGEYVGRQQPVAQSNRYRPNAGSYETQPSVIVAPTTTRAPTRIETASYPGTGEVIEEKYDAGSIISNPVPLATRVVPNTGVNSNTGWRWPAKGAVVRDYAPSEVNGQGIDIAGTQGEDIIAVADGSVIYAGRDLSDSGNLVIIRHANDVLSTYSHVRDLYVAEEDTVSGGDTIATLGVNKKRESVLHFGVRVDGKPANPSQYLPARYLQ